MVRAIAFAAAMIVAATLTWGYTLLDRPSTANACGAAGPFDFDTIESARSATEYKAVIDLAVQGSLVPGSFQVAGETVNLAYQGLLVGNRAHRTGLEPLPPEMTGPAGEALDPTTPSTLLRIPPTVYYAIAWVESNWQNATYSVPWGGVGPTLRSFDCGFGLGQITTGMRNETGTPTAKQALVGTHPAFNVAEGVRILADKWNQAPRFRPIAGNGDPAALEDWYYAIWSYNGFAFVNHPLNPGRDPLRGGNGTEMIYHCYDESAPSYIDTGGSLPLYAYGDYTYPERVYGCMRFPPTVTPGRNPDAAPGTRLWQPVAFNMPRFDQPAVSQALDPVVWDTCDVRTDGCAAMDFPTSFPDVEIATHPDIVPRIDTAGATAMGAQVFGSPALAISGPASASLEVLDANGTAESVRVTVENTGTLAGAYRVRSSAPWLVARHPGDSSDVSIDGGVAIGSGTEVVVIASPRRTRAGYVAELDVTLDWREMELGAQSGTITIEPIWGSGNALTIAVEGSTAFEPPIDPTPTPTPTSAAPPSVTPSPTPVAFEQHAPGLKTAE